MLSYCVPDMLKNHYLKKDLKKAVKLVEECFEQFPKEFDSITRVILFGLIEGTDDFEEILFYQLLLKHLEKLYYEFARAIA